MFCSVLAVDSLRSEVVPCFSQEYNHIKNSCYNDHNFNSGESNSGKVTLTLGWRSIYFFFTATQTCYYTYFWNFKQEKSHQSGFSVFIVNVGVCISCMYFIKLLFLFFDITFFFVLRPTTRALLLTTLQPRSCSWSLFRRMWWRTSHSWWSVLASSWEESLCS